MSRSVVSGSYSSERPKPHNCSDYARQPQTFHNVVHSAKVSLEKQNMVHTMPAQSKPGYWLINLVHTMPTQSKPGYQIYSIKQAEGAAEQFRHGASDCCCWFKSHFRSVVLN